MNDGHEHRVRASRRGRNGTLVVDDDAPILGTSSGILAMLNVEGHLYVGGVPELATMTGGLHTRNFVGCLADIVLNGRRMDLMADAIDGRNVRPCESWRSSDGRLRRRRQRHRWLLQRRRYHIKRRWRS